MMDLRVHSSVGIGEAIERAKALGLKGMGFVSYLSEVKDVSKWVKQFKEEEVVIVPGLIIKTEKPDELSRFVEKVRDKVLLVMVEGRSYAIHRAACENPKVDVLCNPEKERSDSGFDHICAKAAAENRVAIEINFKEVLDSYRKKRVAILARQRRNIKLCKKFNVPIVITSGAENVWDMRSGKDLSSLGNLLGLELDESLAAVEITPEDIIERNRKRIEGG